MLEFICKIGIRMLKATNAITEPIATIISGSSPGWSATFSSKAIGIS